MDCEIIQSQFKKKVCWSSCSVICCQSILKQLRLSQRNGYLSAKKKSRIYCSIFIVTWMSMTCDCLTGRYSAIYKINWSHARIRWETYTFLYNWGTGKIRLKGDLIFLQGAQISTTFHRKNLKLFCSPILGGLLLFFIFSLSFSCFALESFEVSPLRCHLPKDKAERAIDWHFFGLIHVPYSC